MKYVNNFSDLEQTNCSEQFVVNKLKDAYDEGTYTDCRAYLRNKGVADTKARIKTCVDVLKKLGLAETAEGQDVIRYGERLRDSYTAITKKCLADAQDMVADPEKEYTFKEIVPVMFPNQHPFHEEFMQKLGDLCVTHPELLNELASRDFPTGYLER